MYRLFADAVLLLHLAFILFVIWGGFLLFRLPRLAWLHLPAAIWGTLMEFSGWVCPLTPLENYFRIQAGQRPYHGDFIERYLLPLIYPANLRRDLQLLLGLGCLMANGLIYALLFKKNWQEKRRQRTPKRNRG